MVVTNEYNSFGCNYARNNYWVVNVFRHIMLQTMIE